MNIFQDNDPRGSWNNSGDSGQNNSSSNEWSGGDPLGQDPFFSRPVLSAGERLAAVSFSMAMASMITTVFMTVILPLILAPISIVLAVISKGSERKLKGRAKHAVIAASLAIIINCGMIVSSFVTMFVNPQVRASVNQIMVPSYGITVEQEIEAFDADFGTDLSSLLQGDSSQYGSGLIPEGGVNVEDL